MARISTSTLNTGISILALLTSIASLGFTWWQTAQLKKEFELSGPVVSVSSQLQVAYEDKKKPAPANRDEADHPVVNFDTFEKYSEVWLKESITNNGRSDTTIRDALMEISPEYWVDATSDGPKVWCKEERKDSVDCKNTLPFLLHPANTLVILFPLHEWRNSFARTRFGAEGIPLEVRATGVKDPVKYVSGIRAQA